MFRERRRSCLKGLWEKSNRSRWNCSSSKMYPGSQRTTLCSFFFFRVILSLHGINFARFERAFFFFASSNFRLFGSERRHFVRVAPFHRDYSTAIERRFLRLLLSVSITDFLNSKSFTNSFGAWGFLGFLASRVIWEF